MAIIFLMAVVVFQCQQSGRRRRGEDDAGVAGEGGADFEDAADDGADAGATAGQEMILFPLVYLV